MSFAPEKIYFTPYDLSQAHLRTQRNDARDIGYVRTDLVRACLERVAAITEDGGRECYEIDRAIMGLQNTLDNPQGQP